MSPLAKAKWEARAIAVKAHLGEITYEEARKQINAMQIDQDEAVAKEIFMREFHVEEIPLPDEWRKTFPMVQEVQRLGRDPLLD